jgi:hypothetical protein
MKLKSFGCSFIYGSDLEDTSSTWPSLLAQRLDLDHECYAVPGSGNLQILESILSQVASGDAFFLVNWTWIDRFDFISLPEEKWETLRPSTDHANADYYYRNLHSQYRDVLTNLSYIKIAIDSLKQKDLNFVMTYMDSLLFEKINPNWHDPKAVEYLQTEVLCNMCDFFGKNFLDWSRDSGFDISDSWHPLEDAHAAAADHMLPIVAAELNND